MARFEYACNHCGESFVVEERMSEQDADASPECPECGSGETRQLMSEFVPDTSDKS